MLPFLKSKKHDSGVIVEHRMPDGDIEEKGNLEDKEEGLHLAAEDLLKALEEKDLKKIASALKATFAILDSEPHTEGPHINKDEE